MLHRQLKQFDKLYDNTEIEHDASAKPHKSLRFVRTHEDFIDIVGMGPTTIPKSVKSKTFPKGIFLRTPSFRRYYSDGYPAHHCSTCRRKGAPKNRRMIVVGDPDQLREKRGLPNETHVQDVDTNPYNNGEGLEEKQSE